MVAFATPSVVPARRLARPVCHPAAPVLVTVCAWCTPGVGGPNVTHGICPTHQAEMLAEVAAFKAQSTPSGHV
jgi:hypothetical protein